MVAHQAQYSLVHREIEYETLPLCRDNQIAVLPWSPLAGGVLTGKYRTVGETPSGTRFGESQALASRFLNETNLLIAEEVSKVAVEIGHTPAQVALNWVFHQPGVTAPIVGVRSLEQLRDNLGAEGWRLADEHVIRLAEASRRPLPYPFDMYERLGIPTG